MDERSATDAFDNFFCGKEAKTGTALARVSEEAQCLSKGWAFFYQSEAFVATGFLLHHDCTRSDLPAADEVAYLHLHQVAAPEFAVDRQVE